MKKQFFAAASAFAFAVAGHAHAQAIDYGSLEALFGQSVTTSATGSPQKASDAPASMEIITAEDIERSGATDIPGVLKHVAGIDVLQWNLDNSDVGVRGYDKVLSARLLVLIDGRQVYADYYGYTPWSALPVELGAIRQIEVVKGPNSALFGFNAVGGVINIVTYNPLYDDINTASLTGGTQGMAQGSAVTTIKLGDIGGLRLSAGGRSDNDFSTPQTPASVGTRRGNNRGAIDLNGTFRLSDTVLATVEVSHTEADYTEVLPTQSSSYFDRYGTDSAKGAVSADTDWGALQVSVYSNWIKFLSNPGATNAPTGFVNQVTVTQLQDTFKIGSDNTVRVTGEYRHNTMEATENGSHTFYDVLSGGGMWEWRIDPTLTLTNALRLDDLMLGRDGAELPGVPLPNSAWNVTSTLPSFNSGLVWRESDVDTFRATAARGVQVPNLLEYGGISSELAPGLFLTGTPTLAPTIVMNYEVSWDRAVPSLDGQLTVNLFHQTNNEIAGQSIAGFTFLNGKPAIVIGVTVGSSNATGLEIAFKGAFLQDWRWGLSYTPEIITDHFGPGLGLADTGADYQHTTPTHVVKANLGWAHGPWEIDGYLQYLSSSYGIGLNPAASPIAFSAGKLVPISDYVAVDGRIAYKLTNWATLALSAQDFTQASQQQTVSAKVERQVYGSISVNF